MIILSEKILHFDAHILCEITPFNDKMKLKINLSYLEYFCELFSSHNEKQNVQVRRECDKWCYTFRKITRRCEK